MRRKTIILLILIGTVNLSKCQKRDVPRNVVASILQEALSPANTENALQMINIAAGKSMPEMTVPVQTIVTRGREMPGRIIPNTMPIRIGNEMQMPIRMANEIQVLNRLANDGAIIINQAPVRSLPNDFIIAPVSEKFVIQEGIPVQKMMIDRRINTPVHTCMPNIIANVPGDITQLPVAMVNPFLPPASPVSALSPPISASLSFPTQVKGQFLRKIPIPPPTL